MLNILWALLMASLVGMVWVGLRFVQEQMTGPTAVRLVPDVTPEPMPQERMPQHPVTEIPMDDDQARRSVMAS